MTSLSCGPTTTVGGAWRSIATMTDADEPASGAEGPGRRHLAEFPGAHRTICTRTKRWEIEALAAQQNLEKWNRRSAPVSEKSGARRRLLNFRRLPEARSEGLRLLLRC